MSELFSVAAENLALWRESAAEACELCCLQQIQLGREAAQSGQTSELQDLKAICVEEQIAFCRGFLEASPKEAEHTAPPPAAPRIAFLDSFFSREALRRFESALPMARPLTAPSFTAVCEELASGHADFALLPIEDSREGRFRHLFEEIDRFELRLCMSCEIPYPDEGRAVTVALLSRQNDFAPRPMGERLLSLTLFDEDSHALLDLLQAALIMGITLKRIDSLPAPYGEGGVFYHPVFRVGTENEQLFEAYLAICHPRARVVGRYWNLK